jgi:hypothetical protein
MYAIILFTRVTRLGEFVYFGEFLEKYRKYPKCLGYFIALSSFSIHLDKNELGYNFW